jgi:hypothetical protein
MRKVHIRWVSSVLALTLAACGGGGSDSSTPPADTDRDGIADANDCASNDVLAWQVLTFASRNDDGDTARVNATGQVCTGATLPANRFAAAVPAADTDCDDANASAWISRTYAAVDADGDGAGIAASGSVCSGAALPAGYVANLPALADLDCDDADLAKWRLTAHAGRDGDGDGRAVAAAGSWCGQGPLPPHLFAQAPAGLQVDCDDADAARWNWQSAFRDRDGDGVGAGPAAYQCLGNGNYPTGFVRAGYDPNDDPNDPAAAAQTELAIDSVMLTVDESMDDDD